MKMLKGQTVQLTPQGYRAHIKSRGKVYKSLIVKWKGRTGIIQEINSKGARVIWQGNKYPADFLALAALQLVENLNDRPDPDGNTSNLCCAHCPYRGHDA